MIKELMQKLHNSPTPYHAVEVCKQDLIACGYTELIEGQTWQIKPLGKYYVIKDGSGLIAFCLGDRNLGFNIFASHTDSPALKLKYNPSTKQAKQYKLNVERYGGGLNYTWFDKPLVIAGRIVYLDKVTNCVCSKLVKSDYNVVIPSLAIHLNRDANTNFAPNVQIDLQPLFAGEDTYKAYEGELIDYDLFLACNQEPFFAGQNGEYLVSPRLDNLTSAFASIDALKDLKSHNVALAFMPDNEEVGSSTKQGAGGTFLVDTLRKISVLLDNDYDKMLANSFMLSCDNAHAAHPNHLEKSDTTNIATLNGGVVIKHHANQNYTTDAMSSAVIKYIAKQSNIAIQDSFSRSDVSCGSTLGAISSQQLSIRSVDIGLAQLAMHSTSETMGAYDYDKLVNLAKAYYACSISCNGYDKIEVTF
ncbi:MAG: M18 family aminopeptidase [Clostridia bacterium]